MEGSGNRNASCSHGRVGIISFSSFSMGHGRGQLSTVSLAPHFPAAVFSTCSSITRRRTQDTTRLSMPPLHAERLRNGLGFFKVLFVGCMPISRKRLLLHLDSHGPERPCAFVEQTGMQTQHGGSVDGGDERWCSVRFSGDVKAALALCRQLIALDDGLNESVGSLF